MKITCDIVSDLLPLYIDEICTDDSKAAVDEHIEKCKKCRQALNSMTSDNPIELSDKSERNQAVKPFRKLKLRFIFWLCFGIFCTSVIISTLAFAGAFDNIERSLGHFESCIIEIPEPTDEWVTIEENRYYTGYFDDPPITLDYLEIRGLFPKKRLDCSFPDTYYAEIRIIDEDRNIILEPTDIQGGMMNISVKELKTDTKYYVQCRTETGGTFCFNFS